MEERVKLKKAAALLMGIVLILSPVSSVQASDVSSESQIVVTSEVSNESESESLDSDENESMETQSEVAETSKGRRPFSFAFRPFCSAKPAVGMCHMQ